MKILFIGHSLIEFFDWHRRFPAHEVANLGMAGETVEGLFSRVDLIIDRHPSADVIVIMTGLNNIAINDFGFVSSCAGIIRRLSAAYTSARILLTSILPTMLEFVTNESIKEVNVSMSNLAGDLNIEFMDIYNLFVDKEGEPLSDLYLDDGVHLSDKGYAVWSKEIEKLL